MRAVALLSWWKFRNSLRTLFTDPRKFIPFILVACSITCGFGSMLIGTLVPHKQQFSTTLEPSILHAVLMLAMILVGLTTLDMGLGDRLLAFGMPDVDYLFPSPISRRTVLAYRLPAFTGTAILAAGVMILVLTMSTNNVGIEVPNMGAISPPGWLRFASVALCIGIYMNLGLFVAIQFRNLGVWHKLLTGAIFLLLAVIGLVAWRVGIHSAVDIVESNWLKWLLAPSRLAADALYASFSHDAYFPALGKLLLGYGVSLTVLFSSKANYYEQSIVSTERASTMRQAAKGGYASLMAARAANYKHRSTKDYTVKPFGRGAIALLWAHLCAASKKPWTTFVVPVVLGVIIGIVGALVNHLQKGVGFAVLGFAGVYGSFGFLASARTAAEAAIRRRELISPLPIPGWKTVAANLGVPWSSAILFGVGASISYAVSGGDRWPLVAACLGLLLPTHVMTRMALQYGLSIGYTDLSDKIQQLLGGLMYYVFAGPLMLIEAVLCIPAILLQSIWVGVLAVTLFQIPLMAGLLLIAGRASDRAVASGEPVSLFSALKK